MSYIKVSQARLNYDGKTYTSNEAYMLKNGTIALVFSPVNNHSAKTPALVTEDKKDFPPITAA